MLNSLQLPTGSAQIAASLDGRYLPLLIPDSIARQVQNEESAYQKNYVLYREYYDGLHETQISERIRAFLNVKNDVEFNLNLCPIVVDALAERLKVTGFDAGNQGETLWQWWQDSRMDAQQGVVHTGAIRDGDFFMMVEWDNEERRPCFTFELACSGTEGVKVHYSKEKRGKIAYASKRWIMERPGVGKNKRLNLYFDNHIEKYIGDDGTYEGNWRPFIEEGDDGLLLPGVFGPCGWHWWTSTRAEGGDPLGVPIVHFKNKDQGYDRGQSELANVIPLQNALNKTVIDLLGAADTAGFPVYTGTGDKFTNMTVAPGRFMSSEKPEAKIGKLDASDLSKMIAIKDSFSMDIARVSRTPISYFQTSSQLPAEGSEQQREVGLIAKGDKCTTDFGNAWEDLMKIARRLNNAFGGTKMDEKQRISTQWRPLEKRKDLELLQELTLKKGLGVIDDILWSEMGYDATEIRKMHAAKLKSARVFASAAVPAPQTNEPAPEEPTRTAGPTGGANRGVNIQPSLEMNRL